MSDICFAPATELREKIASRELSPVELVDAVLDRIASVDPKIHAFITLDADGARKKAADVEAALVRGENLGPLAGIPTSIKDLEDTAGIRTTYGSKFLENNVPATDGAVAERIRASDAVVLGKTNTPHFGHKDMSDNLIGEAARTPWNIERTAGGSSGGAAAAVAAGLGPFAHGSDGAGSIRIPASLCGVYGLKPSYGLVPYWPNVDLWAARSHNGPIARTVRDAALLLQVMAGPDPRDPLTIDREPDDYLAACDGDLDGLRVAWSPDFGYAMVDPEVRAATEASAKRFTELGCTVEEANPGWDNPLEWHALIYQTAIAGKHGARYDARPDWFEQSLAEMIENGRKYSAVDLIHAQLARTEMQEKARTFMQKYDLLLAPAMPLGAWAYDSVPDRIGDTPVSSMFERLHFMYPINLLGWPAATVPCGFTSEGLPIGLQIIAPWHQDTLVLRASAAFEEMQPWADHRPDI